MWTSQGYGWQYQGRRMAPLDDKAAKAGPLPNGNLAEDQCLVFSSSAPFYESVENRVVSTYVVKRPKRMKSCKQLRHDAIKFWRSQGSSMGCQASSLSWPCSQSLASSGTCSTPPISYVLASSFSNRSQSCCCTSETHLQGLPQRVQQRNWSVRLDRRVVGLFRFLQDYHG